MKPYEQSLTDDVGCSPEGVRLVYQHSIRRLGRMGGYRRTSEGH